MKFNRIKKIASVFLCALSLFAYTGCELDEDSGNGVSVSISDSSVIISDAIVGITTKNISAKASDGSGIVWTTSNASVANIIPKGKNATIAVNGAGKAVIVAATSNGKASARCEVTVTLSRSHCDPVSDAAITEGSVTDCSVTVTWKDSKDMSYANVVILNDDSSVFSTTKVPAGIQTCTVNDIITDNDGIDYKVRVDAVRNEFTAPGTPMDFTTLPDATPCAEVTEIDAVVEDHSITLTWADPLDEDFASVKLSVAGAKLDDSVIDETVLNIVNVSQNKTAQQLKFTALKANTDYTFTLKTVDKAGNVSEGASKIVRTAVDTTAPEKVTDVLGKVSIDKVILEWNDPSDIDFKEVVISCEGIEDKKVLPGVKKATISGLTSEVTYTFSIKTVDIDGNVSEAVVKECTPTIPYVTSVRAVNYATGAIAVKWTDNGDEDAKFKVELKNGGSVVKSLNVARNVQTASFTGLDTSTTYDLVVSTIVEDVPYSNASTTVTCTSDLMIWDIVYCHGYYAQKDRLYRMTPDKGTNLVITNYNVAESDQPNIYWIVRPSVAHPEDPTKFSLEACKKDGTPSGLYMYSSDAAVPSGSSYTGWGRGYEGTASKSGNCMYFVDTLGTITEAKYGNAEFSKEIPENTYSPDNHLWKGSYDEEQFCLVSSFNGTKLYVSGDWYHFNGYTSNFFDSDNNNGLGIDGSDKTNHATNFVKKVVTLN